MRYRHFLMAIRTTPAQWAAIPLALLALCGCPDDDHVVPDLTGVTVQTLEYGRGYVAGGEATAPLYADLYAAKDTAPDELVVVIHGGGFEEGSRAAREIVWLSANIARAGYAALAIDYRLAGDAPPAPDDWSVDPLRAMHAASVDLLQALRWAAAQGYARVFVAGESAGGIAAVQTCAAPADFLQDRADLPGLNTGAPADVAALVVLWGGAGLAEIGPGMPPVRIVHGTEDNTFGASSLDAWSLNRRLESAGVECDLVWLDDWDHGAWIAETDYGDISAVTLDWFAH